MPFVEAFQPRELGPKPWGRELLVAQTDKYIGKVLYMEAGKGGAYQYHESKDETMHLLSGEAVLRTEEGYRRMLAGMSYHVPPGAYHQVTAVTDCVFVEASTPVFEDRVVIEP